jgi:very-short-patch-repair endonuclease
MLWRRKDLRKRTTQSEDFLWQELRNNKLGFRFKRQYSIVNYVVDFYCAKYKLAIEIDGGIHQSVESHKYDIYRTRYLESLGIKEIRFNNEQVEKDIISVIKTINNKLPSPEIRRGREGEV